MPRRFTHAALLFAIGALLDVEARADDWEHPGLLRSRDLSPFGLLRLDMRPPAMQGPTKDDWAVELQLSYQNTFVMSPNVEEYLESRNAGRVSLRPEDAEAIFALPDDAYYVDGEVGVYELAVHRNIGERWHAYASIPYIRYGRGVFDGLIESFHDVFGFSQAGRDLVARNRFQIVYEIDGAQVSVLDRPTEGGFGDPVLGLDYRMPLSDPDWSLIVGGAVKLAVDGERPFLSTGEHDFGLQATLERRMDRHAFHASVSAVYFRGSRTPPDHHAQIVPTLIAGWSYGLTSRSNLVLQGYASRSTVRHTNVAELTENKYQLSLGWQWLRGDSMWTIAVVEDPGNSRNTPDVGVQIGFAYGFSSPR